MVATVTQARDAGGVVAPEARGRVRADRTEVDALVRRVVCRDEAVAVDRTTRLDDHVAADTPLVGDVVGTEQLDRVATVVRQVAERAFAERREVEVLGDAGVLLLQGRVHVAFRVALALRPGVRTLQRTSCRPSCARRRTRPRCSRDWYCGRPKYEAGMVTVGERAVVVQVERELGVTARVDDVADAAVDAGSKFV